MNEVQGKVRNLFEEAEVTIPDSVGQSSPCQ